MPGKVVTFYSYKGGVGRSQALANVAVALANRGKRVIIVDMDLESPGIHAFFQSPGRPSPFSEDDLAEQDGFLDFLIQCSLIPEKRPDVRALLRPCSHPRVISGSIRLLPAGKLDTDYGKRLQHFSWSTFYEHCHGAAYIDMIRTDLGDDADYVLIDSRTGMTDAAYVCTYQLAEIVVVLFALHRQGIAGAARIARGIRACQQDEGEHARPRRTLLVASRVDEAGEEEALLEWTVRARAELSGLSSEILLEPEDRFPYMAAAAFGERVVIGGESASILSLAYDRLVQRLVDGDVAHAALRTREQIRPPSELLRQTHLLALRAERLANELSAFTPGASSLRGLCGWAHDISRDRADIEAQAQRIVADARLLAREPVERALPLIEDAAMLRTLPGLLAAAVQGGVSAWTRARLSALADGDEALVTRGLALTAPALQKLDSQGFDEALQRAEIGILEEGIEALLKRNALDRTRLSMTYGDEGACDTWLESRLQSLMGEPDFDAGSRLVLHNLLQLRVTTLMRGEPHHWLAYEYLCLFCWNDDGAQADAFNGIGKLLWRGEWNAAFDDPSSIGPPAAPEAIKALKTFLPGATATSLVDWIEATLTVRWNAVNGGSDIDGLLRRHNDDPLLVAAIDRMAAGTGSHRRALLGAWLSVVDVMKATSSTILGYLRALVDEGYAGEAYYALEALSRIRLDVANAPAAQIVVLGFMLRAIEKERPATVEALWLNDSTAGQILSSRLGKALGAVYAANLAPLPGSSAMLAAAISRHEAMSTGWALPPSVTASSWSQRAPLAVTTAERSRVLKQEIEIQARKRFFSARTTAPVYEQAFQSWAERRLTELEASTLPRSTEALDLGRLEAQRWVDRTYSEQKDRNPGIREPDGVTLDNMVKAFNAVRSALLELNDLRPPQGSPSLRAICEDGARVEVTRQALREWAVQGPNDVPAWIAETLTRLLEGRIA